MFYDYTDDKQYAEELDQKVCKKYPDHALEARKLINKYLHHYDKHRWLVFNGQAADKHLDLGELGTAHMYISSLLQCRDKGQPVTELYLETGVRTLLSLPFAVIEGGKDE